MVQLKRSLLVVVFAVMIICAGGYNSSIWPAPCGGAIISFAEVVERDVLCMDIDLTKPLGNGDSQMMLNSQLGIGPRTDVGLDIPLKGHQRAVFNLTHMAYERHNVSVRVGIIGLGSRNGETVEAVAQIEPRSFILTLGAANSLPETWGFGGVQFAVGSRTSIYLEIVGGSDSQAAATLEWALPRDHSLLLSLITNWDGDESLYVDWGWRCRF